MTAKAEVHRLRSRLDNTFARVDRINVDQLELRADFARYLCVLVSGYVETAVAEALLDHCRSSSAPSVQRYVEVRLRRFTNPKASKVSDLLGGFSLSWKQEFDGFVIDEKRAALDSIVNLRNQIAHGGSVGVSFVQISQYYESCNSVVDYVLELCCE